MADYVYATSSGKTYDELIKEANDRAAKQSAAYAEKANAANESYKASVNAAYDNRIKAQEETAAADKQKAYASYNAQFDANAASQLAQERRLKEQLANYGLTKSGYNATNQTALAVARGNADAATRTARQQAVDAIEQEVRKYKADTEQQRAAALAESDRDTSTRIMDTEQSMLRDAHGEAMDVLSRDDALAEFQWQRETDEENREYQAERDAVTDKQWQQKYDYQVDRDAVTDKQWQQNYDLSERELNEQIKQQAFNNDMTTKEYVDMHNRDVYSLMLNAYNNGNSALAEEYAKELWQINADGSVGPMVFDTSSASKFIDEQVEAERDAALAKAYAQSDTSGNILGLPDSYVKHIQSAGEANDGSAEGKRRALGYMYTLSESAAAQGMSQDVFEAILAMVNLTYEDWEAYIKKGDASDKELVSIPGRYTK